MEKILLIEPNYKNKYPPIGLMKISSYFKSKGDYVRFHKGVLTQETTKQFEKVFITTLFTFDFEICVQTIRYYADIVGPNMVFVGGIAASIMPEKFLEEIPGINLNTGQLVSSNVLGYDDDVNIDLLELDYDMLWDISYEYPAADSYFIYTTRGCPRKCSFCAVKTLEPVFYDCNNIIEQVTRVDAKYGVKKNLLIMDNNILYSKHFSDTVSSLKQLGFSKESHTVQKNSKMKFYLNSLEQRLLNNRVYEALLDRIKKELLDLCKKRIKKDDIEMLSPLLLLIKQGSTEELNEALLKNKEYLSDFFDRYHYHKITRYVDFNQGLDARLFDDDKARDMAQLAVKPCRIAFDDISMKETYLDAMEIAVANGIQHFSNYLLYNYHDEPRELWERLDINIQFCKKHKEHNITLFSFPMKYASIEHTDRSFVGAEWSKKKLRGLNVILNVTSGIVAKEEDFFHRAYGKTAEEFKEILLMPDEFIRYRDFFEQNGLILLWQTCYRKLNDSERDQLDKVLSNMVEQPEILNEKYSENVNNILWFYKLKKRDVELIEDPEISLIP